MVIEEISSKVFCVGTRDWDRRLFDELIPLPDGTSYNAYIIKGSEKTVLIDTVDTAKTAELLGNLQKIGINQLDYVVINHAEEDHSGSLPIILEKFPKAKAIMTPKAKEIVIPRMHLSEKQIITVEDREILSLGDRTLEFIHAPWVHWPETMFTYLKEEKILFTCDFLGSHLATSDLYVTDEHKVALAAKRYYAEIMMPFRKLIQRHLKKIEELDIEIIAPSHGPLYDKPEFILDAYRDWSSDNVKNEVIIPYTSMYGATETLVNHLIEELIKRGVSVKPFSLSQTDIGELAMALVDAATIVVGSPTVLTGPHPIVAYAALLANALKPKAKIATVIGSYGWKGQMVEGILGLLPNLKVDLLNPVVIKGTPTEKDLEDIEKLAEQIYQKHKELAITN
jgi:flavorubredoxin